MERIIKSFKLSCGLFPSPERYCYEIKNNVLKVSATTDKNVDIEKEINIDGNLHVLINSIIKDWKNEYRYEDLNPGLAICDGFTWNLDVVYVDGSEKHVCGHESYPDNYSELLKCLNEALSIDINL